MTERLAVDYIKLTLADMRRELVHIAEEVEKMCGSLTPDQLNWRPGDAQWSVAQCLEHLRTSNELMVSAAREALDRSPTTIWQRLPLLPAVWGRALILSQAPGGTRKYTAPPKSRPESKSIAADIVEQFAAQHRAAASWLGTLDERAMARAIMVSPFIRFVTYSVLDGCRLLVAHDHRHIEQARRVGRRVRQQPMIVTSSEHD